MFKTFIVGVWICIPRQRRTNGRMTLAAKPIDLLYNILYSIIYIYIYIYIHIYMYIYTDVQTDRQTETGYSFRVAWASRAYQRLAGRGKPVLCRLRVLRLHLQELFYVYTCSSCFTFTPAAAVLPLHLQQLFYVYTCSSDCCCGDHLVQLYRRNYSIASIFSLQNNYWSKLHNRT